MSLPRRLPRWACPTFAIHGEFQVCPACLENFERDGSTARGYDMPPRVEFGSGWFSVGATHFFEATDATLFDARDGKRRLAQAICGGICEVTITWAPQAKRECRKCIAALRKRGMLVESKRH